MTNYHSINSKISVNFTYHSFAQETAQSASQNIPIRSNIFVYNNDDLSQVHDIVREILHSIMKNDVLFSLPIEIYFTTDILFALRLPNKDVS